MKNLKRVLSLLLCLIMVVGLVPTTVFAEGSEPEKYKVWVAGTQVTSANAADVLGGGEASYDAETKTLTVKKDIAAAEEEYAAAIKTEEFLTVKIEGSVTLSSSNGYGIDSDNGNLNITGGKLVVKAEKSAVTAAMSISIDCDELDLSGASCVRTSNGIVKLVGDKITMNADNDAIYSRNNVNINCEELNLTAGGTGIYSMDGAIAVSGDKVSIDGAYGINSAKKSVELKGSTPNDGNITVSAYFDTILAEGDITVQCATLDLKSISTDSSYDPHHYSLHLKADGEFIYPAGATVVAATEVDGTFEPYDKNKNDTYDHVKIGQPTSTTYTVTFDSDGGSAVTAQTVESGKTATKPADPTKEGYTFKGWTLDGADYDFATPVTGDITLKANWEAKQTATVIDEIHIGGVTMPVVGATPINSATTSTPGVTIGSATFWVRYVPETNDLDDLYDDSTRVDDTPFRSGVKYSLQVMLETQNGCTIAADAKIFYNGIQLPAPDTSDISKSCAMVHPDGTMAVAYISGEASIPTTYTVTFDSDGGSAVTAQTVEEGKTATKPADPTKEGYTFKGWTLDGAAYDFSSAVTKDITLEAAWEVIPTATVIDEIHIGGVTMPVVGATPINSATTSTPGVTIGLATFWVRYVPETNDLDDLYDDSTRVDDTPFRSGVKYSLQVMLETQNGYTIAADAKIFYNGIQLPAPDTSDISKSCAMVHPDGTMAVAYISGETSVPTTYTVTFDSDGGSTVTAQTVESGKTATKPADPTKEGYTFKGWTLNGTAYDFNTAVTGNITLKATWEAKQATPPAGDNNQGTNKPADTPQTGDSMNLVLWSTLAMVSALAVVVLIVFKKKRYPVK